MNKKGELGNQISGVLFFALIAMIAVGLVAGVWIYFGGGYDSRLLEASVLNFKVSECFKDNLNEFDFSKSNEEKLKEFSEICFLDEDVLKEYYIIEISESEKVLIRFKDSEACRFEGAKGNENFAKCFKKIEIIDGKEYLFITGSNQFSRKRLSE